MDSQLRGDDEYDAMGANSLDRAQALLGKSHSITISKNRGSKVSQKGELLLRKFAQQVEEVFRTLPKPLECRSFPRHDLKLLVETDQEVRRVSTQEELNKSQTSALERLYRISKDGFEALARESPESQKKEALSDKPSPRKRRLRGFSAAEIDPITEKEVSSRGKPPSL